MIKLYRITVLGLVFLATWIAFSGLLDPFHLGLGLVSVTLVLISSHSLFPKDEAEPSSGFNPEILLHLNWRHALLYPAKLLLNIVTANLKVAALVLDPRMPIAPEFFSFKVSYRTDAAKVLLGNAITLTPGTLTLDICDDRFLVHAISPQLASSLYDGSEQNAVARIFGDPELQDFDLKRES